MQQKDRSDKLFTWIVTALFLTFYIECMRENNNSMLYIVTLGAFSGLVIVAAISAGKLYRPNKFFFFCILFYLFGYIHTITGNAIYPEVANEMLSRILVQYISFYAIYIFFRSFDDMDKVVDVLIITGIIVTVIALATSPGIGVGRLGGRINSNTVAVFSGYMCLFLYSKYYQKKKTRYLMLIAYLVIIVLLTGSRKGLLTIGLGIVLINVLMTKNFKIFKVLAFVPVIYIGYLLIINWDFLYNLVGYRVEDLVNYYITGKTNEASNVTRDALIETAMIMVEKKPWIGYGLNNFRFWDYHNLYTHNNYVELLFSGGIPAVIIFYLPHLFMLIKCVKLIKKSRVEAVTILSLLIMIIINDYGMVTYYNKDNLILLLFLYTYIEFLEKRNKEKENEKENMLLHT